MLHIKLKGITKCSDIVAFILPTDPSPSSRHDPRGWGQKVKVKLFQNMAMLHIKFWGITNYTKYSSKCFARRPPSPREPRQISTFSEHGHMLHHAHNEMYFAHNEIHFAHNELTLYITQ